jgi:hypothetical protein
MLKYLRIAVTALSLTACVLLLALWVRSYWQLDMIRGYVPVLREVTGISVQGRMIISSFNTDDSSDWTLSSSAVQDNLELIKSDLPERYLGLDSFKDRVNVVVPHWLTVLLFTALAVAPWLSWRCSLRTLLIATTLVAVALTAIVYASR